ncbi:MAG TPA: hypothetical protein VLO29_05515 [Salegentibacter sp.]|nr:hypothetical protein [Salegentibacter sp.]
MKAKLVVLIVFAIFLSSGNIQAQEPVSQEKNTPQEKKLRPFRIGAKVGFPNIIGGNLEYVTPLLNNKLAVNLDYSLVKADWLAPEEEGQNDAESDDLDFTYLEGGLNYYFFKPGRGLYGGVSYGNIKIKGTLYNQDSRDIVDASHGSFNIKLGAKLGGLIYFRPEVGYAFSALPNYIEGTTVYDDGSRENARVEFDDETPPYNILFSGLIANIGIGFAF